MNPAWQKARWQTYRNRSGEASTYNQMNKVEPMRRALEELHPKAWLAGLHRQRVLRENV